MAKVSPESDQKLVSVQRTTNPSLVHSSWLFFPPNPSFFSFSTNHALFTECSDKGKGTEKPGCLFRGGVSYCLGQAGNWKWCTVGTISTWLSSSMNNTAILLVLASACGAPLSLPPANTFLFSFFSFFSPHNPSSPTTTTTTTPFPPVGVCLFAWGRLWD